MDPKNGRILHIFGCTLTDFYSRPIAATALRAAVDFGTNPTISASSHQSSFSSTGKLWRKSFTRSLVQYRDGDFGNDFGQGNRVF
jgi:hypothetical protein